MTPHRFRHLAELLAGRYWRTRIGPIIERNRSTVFEYANGVRPVDEAVAKLMELLAEQQVDTASQ